MKHGRTETILTRCISTTFVVGALAIFKPFGLDAWQWQVFVHLVALWLIGVTICLLTDVILKYIVKIPRAYDKGAEYIIRRNLWFQLINTPLIALGICIYRHFMMSDRVAGNRFSLTNYFETLVIIAFCSFAIGLYWRFKFRSSYLAAELEETRLLNEELKKLQETHENLTQAPSRVEPVSTPDEQSAETAATPLAQKEDLMRRPLTLTGTTNESVTLQISHLLYIEAVGNYVKVYHQRDSKICTDMLRQTLKQIEEDLLPYPMIVRSHRAFLVNLGQVEQIVSKSGSTQLVIKHSHDTIPLSRSNMAQVKEAIRSI